MLTVFVDPGCDPKIHVMVKTQICRESIHWHYSQVHSDPELLQLLGFHLIYLFCGEGSEPSAVDAVNVFLGEYNFFIKFKKTFPFCINPFPHIPSKCILTVFTNPSARVGYDTRLIFKQSLTGLNSEFSFS